MKRLLLAAWLAASVPASAQSSQEINAPLPRPSVEPQRSFLGRFTHYLWQDWNPDPKATPITPPPRRGLPSPLDAPPFYTSDWGYGGSPTIGEPDTAPYALSTAINGGRSRVKLFGWIEPSVNGSTSSDSNAPVADDLFPNQVVLDRAVLIIERLPDTVQQKHIDWGFHLTNLFGTDYDTTSATDISRHNSSTTTTSTATTLRLTTSISICRMWPRA